MSKFGEETVNNFGSKMIITKYEGSRNIEIFFPEYNWHAINRRYTDFKLGKIKCPYEPRVFEKGWIGEGKYNTRENGNRTESHIVWHDMMRRCYDLKHQERFPTYKNCEVCNEWLNYQNFAEWYDENYYTISDNVMNLDKDILNKGNKIYSPKNCIFVPERINYLFLKRNTKRGGLPIGVTYHKKNNKYQAQCNIGKEITKYLGLYSTPTEAFLAYKTFKELYIKQVADEYKELIPIKLYNAMYSYKVEITD